MTKHQGYTPNPNNEVANLLAPALAHRVWVPENKAARYHYPSITALGHALDGHASFFHNTEFTAANLHPSQATALDKKGLAPEYFACALHEALVRSPCAVEGVTFDQAVSAAKKGGFLDGLDGTHKLQELIDKLHAASHLNATRHTLSNSVAGGIPSIPRALAGSPKAMMQPKRRPSQAPTVKIGFHIGRQWSVSVETVFNRAAALLALVEQIERHGQRVELTACWFNAPEAHFLRGGLDFSVTVKRASDLYTPAALAFATHPLFQRRLAWHHQLIEACGAGVIATSFAADKGGPRHADACQGFDYWVPYMLKDNEHNLATPELAFKHLHGLWLEASKKLAAA